MEAYYESTHMEINKRLFKKANLYSNIKLDSFVIPYMLENDMCIGPQLLDFLEKTLEPFDTGVTKAQDKPQETDDYNSNEVHFDENEEDNGIGDNDNQLGDDEKVNHQNSASTSNASILVSNASQTQAYFPVDVIVIVSMLPSSLRFSSASKPPHHFSSTPESSMDCLLKLPQIDLVFSTKSLSANLNQKTEDNESKKNLY